MNKLERFKDKQNLGNICKLHKLLYNFKHALKHGMTTSAAHYFFGDSNAFSWIHLCSPITLAKEFYGFWSM